MKKFLSSLKLRLSSRRAVLSCVLLAGLFLAGASRVQIFLYQDPGFQGDWAGKKKELTLVVRNGSSQQLADYQLRFELPSNFEGPPFKIVDSQGRELPYCFEQPSGECGTAPTNTVWFKASVLPLGETSFRVISGSGSPVNGDGVFVFYDDFTAKDGTKWGFWPDSIFFHIENGWMVITPGTYSPRLSSRSSFPREGVEVATRVYSGPGQCGVCYLSGNPTIVGTFSFEFDYCFCAASIRCKNLYRVSVGPFGEYTPVFRFYSTHSEACVSGQCFTCDPVDANGSVGIRYRRGEHAQDDLRIDFARVRKLAVPEPEVIVK